MFLYKDKRGRKKGIFDKTPFKHLVLKKILDVYCLPQACILQVETEIDPKLTTTTTVVVKENIIQNKSLLR